MNCKIIAFYVLVLFNISLQDSLGQSLAKDVISSSGNILCRGNIQLCFTLGENVAENIKNTNVTLTQGFHQTSYYICTSDELISVDAGYKLKIYPNPANSYFAIETYAENVDELILKVTDIQGKTILIRQLINNPEIINITHLTENTYLILVFNNKGKKLKTFKLQKHE